MLSRRRRKEISCAARPGLVGDEERIWEMWIGRPVRVERTRRWARDLWVVKRRNSGAGAAIVFGGGGAYLGWLFSSLSIREVEINISRFCRAHRLSYAFHLQWHQ